MYEKMKKKKVESIEVIKIEVIEVQNNVKKIVEVKKSFFKK
jgi:hypothetical protein